eukprot:12133584-Alexandrium_andersonii.AAC.1
MAWPTTHLAWLEAVRESRMRLPCTHPIPERGGLEGVLRVPLVAPAAVVAACRKALVLEDAVREAPDVPSQSPRA